MKKNYFKLFLLGMVVVSTAMISCSKDDDGNNAAKAPVVPVTPTPTVGSFKDASGNYTFTYTNVDGQTDAYIVPTSASSSGAKSTVSSVMSAINKIKIMFADSTNLSGNGIGGIAKFTNGMLKTFTIGNTSYVANLNSKDSLDVAVASKEKYELFKNFAHKREFIPSVSQHSQEGAVRDSISKAFKYISNYITLIKGINGSIISDNDTSSTHQLIKSDIYSIEKYLDRATNSSEVFKKDSNLQEAIDSARTDSTIHVNTEVIDEADSTSEENTDKGYGAIVSGTGKLKVTVTWKFSADIDTHAFEPGTSGFNSATGWQYQRSLYAQGHIWFADKTNTFTDGYLDIDNTRGYWIDPKTGQTDKTLAAVENIYWAGDSIAEKAGNYNIYLHYFSGSVNGDVTVTIFKDGKSIYEKTVNMTDDYNSKMKYIATVNLPSGKVTTTTAAKSGASSPMDIPVNPAYLPKKR